jgi:capsular polysaccharide biosynthesis protein
MARNCPPRMRSVQGIGEWKEILLPGCPSLAAGPLATDRHRGGSSAGARSGESYFCRDALTVEYSVSDLRVSESEKQVYADLANACRRDSADTFGERIFLSRLATSAKHPHFRVLQNECELIAALDKLGFKTVQPERLSVKEQIGMFARAKCVVGLGGSALFSVRFCPPGTTVVDIESSDLFLGLHSVMLSSAGHRFGVIVGQQEPADPTPVHKRWTIDVQRACTAIRQIL